MSTTYAWKTLENHVADGKFPLRRWLGDSDHSAVFLTERSGKENDRAAIKLIPAQDFSSGNHSDETRLSRWAVTARLSHPQLIRLFEFGRCQIEDARFLYVVMEYAEENLGQIIPQRPLSPAEVSEMLPPLAEALGFLHAEGFVHGGIKPSNILAVGDQLKISTDGLHNIGEPAEKKNTVYEAPEAGAGLSPAADAWSLGVLLVTALSQHEPDVLKREAGKVSVSDALPERYRTIAQSCLQVDPNRRCTINEILGKPAPNNPAPTIEENVEKDVGANAKNRWIRPALALVCVVIVVALFAGRMMTRHRAAPPPEVRAPETQSPSPVQSPAPVANPPQSGTVRGAVLHQVLPEISRQAQRTVHGRVKVNVEVSVDVSGNVAKEKLVSAVSSHYFASKALAASQGWKFAPPQVSGQPSPSTWILRFQFGRGSTQVFPTQTKP